MRVYTIFDDFGSEPADLLRGAGVDLTVHPLGVPRPSPAEMKQILEEYDGVIIGTSQKMGPDTFAHITVPKVIATASVGLDHIQIPAEKRDLIQVFNCPTANAQSVAEFTVASALSCCKRLEEGTALYRQGRDNKALRAKPEDLSGKTLGVVGAGNISVRIMEFAAFFGMTVLCWTAHPEHHRHLEEQGVRFVALEELVCSAEVISVNLPNSAGTQGLISRALVNQMRPDAIFISVSRLPVVDLDALLDKARAHAGFYVCLDIDVTPEVTAKLEGLENVRVTPHIAGGTAATRKRMFLECARQIVNYEAGRNT